MEARLQLHNLNRRQIDFGAPLTGSTLYCLFRLSSYGFRPLTVFYITHQHAPWHDTATIKMQHVAMFLFNTRHVSFFLCVCVASFHQLHPCSPLWLPLTAALAILRACNSMALAL